MHFFVGVSGLPMLEQHGQAGRALSTPQAERYFAPTPAGKRSGETGVKPVQFGENIIVIFHIGARICG
ncbi:MAG: hypothetical protein ABWY08_15920 [Comamonas sp.]